MNDKKSISEIGKPFHITVGTFPSDKPNLNQEIKLVKAALLYADRVKLYSLTASAIRMTAKTNALRLIYRVDLLEKVAKSISSEDSAKRLLTLWSQYRELSKKKYLNKQELIRKNQFERLLAQNWDQAGDVANKMVKESKIEKLNQAIDLGLLELHTFKDTDTSDAAVDFMADSIVRAASRQENKEFKMPSSQQNDKILQEYVEQVGNAVSNRSTYPLFDEGTGLLVNAGIKANKIKAPNFGIEHGKQVELAKHLFEYLPSFEDADIDEIIDIRKELDKPLTRFRKAVITFSNDINLASWDEDFLAEADKVFYKDVKPAMIEIDDAIKSNKFLASLARKFIEKPAALPVGSAISLVMSNLLSLPQEISLSLGIGVSSAAIIYEAYDEWKKKKQITEQNLIYFYYQANKRLNT